MAETSMIWPEVIGQQRVKRYLAGVFQEERLPNAFLFSGAEGVGKDAMAVTFGRALHCERNGIEPCGTCSSCIKVRSLQHPDIKFIFALPHGRDEDRDDAPLAKVSDQDIKTIREQLRLKGENLYHRLAIPKANVIKISSIREARSESAMTTFDGRRRVIIISRAEEMGEEASNTLLKTLEEPSRNTMFILTSSQPDALLPTIRSRCQLVRFEQLSPEEIQAVLVGRDQASPQQAELVSRLALGSLTRAVELLDADIAQQRQEAITFIRNTLGASFCRLMEQVDKLASLKDRDFLVRFFTLLNIWFRDALVLREQCPVISVDQHDELLRFVRKFPNADLVRVLEEVERAIFLVQRNVYLTLVLVQLSIRLKRHILPAPFERADTSTTASLQV